MNKTDHSPEIHVGILKASLIRIGLEGRFRLGDRPSVAEKAGAGTVFEGVLEARSNGNRIDLLQDGTVVYTGDAVLLVPVRFRAGKFVLRDVVIGIGFHWEQKEDQAFRGTLKLMVLDGEVQAINLIPLEDYLVSVVSSEMREDSEPALLEAHTIISRSWLMAQVSKQDALTEQGSSYDRVHETAGEYIRWYDREDHEAFHVCADDHCQRYQGITRARNPVVERAVRNTTGEILLYKGTICDARYSKCCGGVTERFGNCWEPVHHPYLRSVADRPEEGRGIAGQPAGEGLPDTGRPAGDGPPVGDLRVEENAVRFIHDPPDAFCRTTDPVLLGQVLNDYDLSSRDFYRWKVTLRQEELAGLIRDRSHTDFGHILDLVPVQRGDSGRLVKLKIVGSRRTLTIGKELEIRRWLSTSHLYSSAFVPEKRRLRRGVPEAFILHGAGWGHGVGLCQIGAAVMASRGYSYREILRHYFRDAEIGKRYQ